MLDGRRYKAKEYRIMLMFIKIHILEKGTDVCKGRKIGMTDSIGTMLYSFQCLFLYVISSFLAIKLSKMIRGGIVIAFTYRRGS